MAEHEQAIGNSDDEGLAIEAVALLDDESSLVRSAAVWASVQLLAPGAFEELRRGRAGEERDLEVRAEWALEPVA